MQRKWHDWEIKMLGTDTDREIAKKLKISQSTVRVKRNQLGIRPFHNNRHNWTKAELALLGKVSDVKVSNTIGLNVSSVREKRAALKIKRFDNDRLHIWTVEEVSLLGTMSDTELAKIVGVSSNAVRGRRTREGIKPFSENLWIPELIENLGLVPDEMLGKEYNLKRCIVCRKRILLKIDSYQYVDWETVAPVLTVDNIKEVSIQFCIPISILQQWLRKNGKLPPLTQESQDLTSASILNTETDLEPVETIVGQQIVEMCQAKRHVKVKDLIDVYGESILDTINLLLQNRRLNLHKQDGYSILSCKKI